VKDLGVGEMTVKWILKTGWDGVELRLFGRVAKDSRKKRVLQKYSD
jgi:hypothetical protein